MRQTQKPHDWIRKESDENLLKICSKIINESIELESECKKYGFYYYNTFNNRDKILKNIVKQIKKQQR